MVSLVFVGLALLDGLLLWAIVGLSRGLWPLKLAAIVIVTSFNLLIIHASFSGSGYPVRGHPPDGVLVTCFIEEPQPHAAGAIYLWLVPLKQVYGGPLGYKPGPYEPRAYMQPYTRSLHILCNEQKKERAGGGGPMVLSSHRGSEIRGPRVPFHLYPLPIERPPRKVGP